MRLKNKVALVTGGTRGMGPAVLKRLAAEGATVAFTYSGCQSAAEALLRELASADRLAIAIQIKSDSSDAVQKAVSQTVKTLGAVDILVNNAGFASGLNLQALYVATQAVTRKMKAGGRIIILGSTIAEPAPFFDTAAYVLGKKAITSLTRALAEDLNAHGITVNNVQTTRQSFGDKAGDVASLVAYLVSSEASQVTGTSFTGR